MTANNNNETLTTDTNPPIADHSAENKLPAPEHNREPLATLNQKANGGRLELLEERPVVNKERLDVGKVTVTKHSRTKTIQVPIELVEEYITVRTDYNDAESQDLLSGNYDDKDILRHVEPALDSKAVVTINGKQVEIGDAPIEIILSRQVATITKDTYVIQEVDVNKSTHTHTDNIEVTLKHEELDVTEEGFLEHERSPIQKK
ncbi:YsnF/AvaK domain-containing protein [Psychrobacter okhotskensis]|uniref:YsnF/AvaK domain-containing protein n=1 Tax=Psychrobacter okhotskensis TaxID=212403 RepID=UPI0015664F45|nr:YsnF/AvaK domain-containing protein [Psychrobacter okhotskensis]NRD69693.1 YsnF/AvaK domain-containing protein [Psychrobacter okhotskensis]